MFEIEKNVSVKIQVNSQEDAELLHRMLNFALNAIPAESITTPEREKLEPLRVALASVFD